MQQVSLNCERLISIFACCTPNAFVNSGCAAKLNKKGFAKLFPQNYVYRRLDNLYKKYDWKKQQYAGTINASLFAKEVMPVEIWGEGVGDYRGRYRGAGGANC